MQRRSLAQLIDDSRMSAMQGGVVALVLLVLVIDGLDVQILSLVAPVVIEDWSASRAAFGPALAAALAGMAVGSAAGGWLGDRIGRRKTLLASVAVFALFTFAVALSEGITQLAMLRFLSGVGFGAALPSGLALAAEWVPARLRTATLTILSIGVPTGGMLGAPLAMLLLPSVGWRGCFIVCGALTMVILVAMVFKLPESPAYLASTGREDVARDLVGRSLGIAPEEIAAESQSLERGGQSIFIAEHLRMNVGIWMVFFFTSAMTYAVAAWTPVLLTGNGFRLDEAIRAIFYHNAAAIGSSLVSSFVINRFGSRRALPIALFVCMLIILAIMVVVAGADARPAAIERNGVIALFASLGAAVGFAMATNYSVLSLGYPPRSRGSGIGAGVMAGRLGAISMVASGGVLIEASPRGWLLLGLLAGACVVALIGALMINRHIPPLV